MKISETFINKNLKVYNEAREILPIIKEYEDGLITPSSMRSLGLSNFVEFSDFLTDTRKSGFEPVMSDMTWRKLKPLLVEKTETKRLKTFMSNRTQNQFRSLLNDGETFDRLINGRWQRKPIYTKRGRKTSGCRSNERLESLDTCIVPIINYIIQTDADIYEDNKIHYESFINQFYFSRKIRWYLSEILNFDKIPKREIDVTRNLLTNLVNFIDESKIDFRKLNSDYLSAVINDKIKKLMIVPTGTVLKCIKESSLNNVTSLTVGNTYEVRSCTFYNGYIKVLVTNDRKSSDWYEYSHFEDMSIHREDILSTLFN